MYNMLMYKVNLRPYFFPQSPLGGLPPPSHHVVRAVAQPGPRAPPAELGHTAHRSRGHLTQNMSACTGTVTSRGELWPDHLPARPHGTPGRSESPAPFLARGPYFLPAVVAASDRVERPPPFPRDTVASKSSCQGFKCLRCTSQTNTGLPDCPEALRTATKHSGQGQAWKKNPNVDEPAMVGASEHVRLPSLLYHRATLLAYQCEGKEESEFRTEDASWVGLLSSCPPWLRSGG